MPKIKLLLAIVILLFCKAKSYAQTFEHSFGKVDTSEILNNVIEGGNYYYTIGWEFGPEGSIIAVSKWSEDGIQIKKKDFNIKDNLWLHDLIMVGDSSIFILGTLSDGLGLNSTMFILNIDNDLNKLWQKKYKYRWFDQFCNFKIKKIPNGNLLISGELKIIAENKARNYIEIDTSGAIIEKPNSYIENTSTADYFILNDTLYAVMIRYSDTGITKNYTSLAKFNQVGDYISSKLIDNFQHTFPLYYKPLNDSIFEIIGRGTSNKLIFRTIVNRNFNIIQSDTIFINYRKIFHQVVKINNSYFLSGEDDGSLFICSIDSNFNTLTEIINHTRIATACSMLKTNDNHLLIGGYYMSDISFDYDYYFLKINYNGTFNSIMNKKNNVLNNIYPNPSKEKIYFKKEGISEYVIYDIMGKAIIVNNNYDGNGIYIGDLPNSVYLIRAINKGSEFISEVFIKE